MDGYYRDQITPTITNKEIELTVKNDIIHIQYQDNTKYTNHATADYEKRPSTKKKTNEILKQYKANNFTDLLDKLSPVLNKKRNIVLSLRINGNSFRKIALKTGVPLSTVWREYHRTIKRIRKRLNIPD